MPNGPAAQYMATLGRTALKTVLNCLEDGLRAMEIRSKMYPYLAALIRLVSKGAFSHLDSAEQGLP